MKAAGEESTMINISKYSGLIPPQIAISEVEGRLRSTSQIGGPSDLRWTSKKKVKNWSENRSEWKWKPIFRCDIRLSYKWMFVLTIKLFYNSGIMTFRFKTHIVSYLQNWQYEPD